MRKQPCWQLGFGLLAPELGESEFPLFKPPSLWYFHKEDLGTADNPNYPALGILARLHSNNTDKTPGWWCLWEARVKTCSPEAESGSPSTPGGLWGTYLFCISDPFAATGSDVRRM